MEKDDGKCILLDCRAFYKK